MKIYGPKEKGVNPLPALFRGIEFNPAVSDEYISLKITVPDLKGNVYVTIDELEAEDMVKSLQKALREMRGTKKEEVKQDE